MAKDPPGPEDPDEIARKFLDLWQQQLAAVGAEDQVADTVLQMTRTFFAGAAASASSVQDSAQDLTRAAQKQDQPESDGDAATDRAAARGLAPLVDRDELEQLEDRVAALEDRIDRLELKTQGYRRRPRVRSRRS